MQKRDEAGNKWLEHEEGSLETATKMRPPKRKRRGGKKKGKAETTKCFLVSSGGWAFVWNENSECLRDYSGLAGPRVPSSYLYTRNMENGNHHCVCMRECVCVSPIMSGNSNKQCGQSEMKPCNTFTSTTQQCCSQKFEGPWKAPLK